jgi:hypothetical protein
MLSMLRLADCLRRLDAKQDALDVERNNLNAEIGETMRRERRAYGRSLRQEAKRLRISAPYLSDVELGRRNPAPVLRRMGYR